MKITTEKSFKLKRGEVKAFFAELLSDKTVSVFAKFSGFPEAKCVSCEGRDYLGKEFTKAQELKAGEAKRLWFYVRVPKDAKAGDYKCTLTVTDENGNELAGEEISVSVTEELIGNEQFSDIESLRRIYWLNSDFAIDNEVPKPFIPVKTEGKKIELLGREIELDEFGFPKSVGTYFSESVSLCDKKTEILSGAMKLQVGNERFENKSFSVDCDGAGANVKALNESENFKMELSARIEFDGFCDYKVKLIARNDVSVGDVNFNLPVNEYSRKYFMGLGKDGGYFDGELDWKWDVEKHQDCFWVGNVNAGIRVKFKGENYRKPLVNIYYSYKPLMMPESWDNNSLGGIEYLNGSFIAYSGKRDVKAGEELHFDFDLIVTPLKPINLKKHFNTRIFHKPPAEKIDLADSKTANVVNVHHGNDLNPYINYPFFENEALGEFIKNAHDKEMLVKVYYTIRELTVHLPEFKALQDLGTEIFEAPAREVDPAWLWQTETLKWVRENIGENLIPAWRQALKGEKYKDSFDSAVITDGQSRLCNFYIEGLKYLVDFLEIDGIYVDDVAYDRNTMKRVRKVLDRRPKALIDFHTWNHHVARGGFSNSFTLYTELLPYIDKMWVGEGYDHYTQSIDYWLVEISGIPFGLMSELMLKGNPHRGLLFGMTNRLSWTKDSDPTNMWELFDKYSLGDCELIGPWDSRNNVKLSNPNVYATLYKRGDKKFIALGNWTDEEQTVKIELIGESDYSFRIPEIRDFQPEVKTDGTVSVPASVGYFIEVV